MTVGDSETIARRALATLEKPPTLYGVSQAPVAWECALDRIAALERDNQKLREVPSKVLSMLGYDPITETPARGHLEALKFLKTRAALKGEKL